MIEERICRLVNDVLRKGVINRLPKNAMLWSRLPDYLIPLIQGEIGLDLGCGKGSQLPFQRLRWIGVDVHRPSLVNASAKGEYEGLICADISRIGSTIRPKSVDVVVALDFIEHLTKSEGMILIKDMERQACQRVIILTPNGHVQQDPRVIADNPWMEHHSAWSKHEFENMGYRVIGWSGWRCLAGPRSYIRRNLDALFQILITVSQPLVEKRPASAFHLLCWKDLARTGQT